jgi:ABC-type microcin C transport system permease subunit YejE
MQALTFIIGGVIVTVIAAVFLPMLMPIIGAFAGAVVGFFFDETSRSFLDALGMKDLEMWQLGAMLGFVGGFFKSYTTVSK